MKIRITHTIYEECEISEEESKYSKEWDKRAKESKMDLLNLLYGSNFIYLDTETEKID